MKKGNEMRILVMGLLMAACIPMMGQSKQVMLETTEGNILLTLYDDTPKHRDNFLRLVEQEFYDSLLFHRVVKNFIIQAGDPNSRHAEPGATLGDGDNGYTIEREMADDSGRILHHHLRGALAMAREGDDVNPEWRSSGCQFYIVWGKFFSTNELKAIGQKVEAITGHPGCVPPEVVARYHKTGGSPHLDGQYTVFGEVTEGLDVVERIQKAFTDDYERPVDDIRILKARVYRHE